MPFWTWEPAVSRDPALFPEALLESGPHRLPHNTWHSKARPENWPRQEREQQESGGWKAGLPALRKVLEWGA